MSTHVRISQEQYEKIRALSEKEKRTIQAQLEIIIEKGLKK